MNMKNWVKDIISTKEKKAMPVLSFPSIQLMDIGVKELISDSEKQAKGMQLIAQRVDSLASVSMMDLSVEAEAFGATIRVSDDEVPTVIGHIVETEEQADALRVPAATEGRTGLYVEAISKACKLITDRPVLAGVIGPFSLTGRLLDVSMAMIYCYDEPEMVHKVLRKTTDFIIEYIKAYKAAGANGVVIAEPLAGLLSPDLNREFSVKYVREIVAAVQDDDFAIVYHNCGNGTIQLIDDILTIDACAYHFGNAIKMVDMLPHLPKDVLVMGNISPSEQFLGGTPESMRTATLELMKECSSYANFVPSSGCDVPPLSSWNNIDAFFAAVSEFYK